MRRIYYVDSKRKKIEQDALLQLRRTLGTLDPVIIDRIRDAIASSFEENQEEEQQEAWAGDSKIPVDHKKNLMTIMKFLELKPGARELQKKIYDLISQET